MSSARTSLPGARFSPGRLLLYLLLALLLLLLAMAAGVGLGTRPSSLVRGLAGDPVARAILLQVRLPRVLVAVVVGAALAGAGTTFQALLGNPLADPFILGISGGAALGAALALLTGLLSPGLLPLAAFAGALAAILVVLAVGSRTPGEGRGTSLLLAGVVLNAFCAALVLFLRSTTDPARSQQVLFWLHGDLSMADLRAVAMATPELLLGLALLLAWSGRLNPLSLGEHLAGEAGLNPRRERALLLVAAALVTGGAVALAGLVGFVGILVPHGVRRLVGPDHRLLLPLAILGGGAFLVAADLIARLSFLLLGSEPPVGVITALCGGPFFLYLLVRRRLA